MTNSSVSNLSLLRMRNFLAIVCASCMLLSSCGRSSAKSLGIAKQNAEQFHSQLNSEQYTAVYASTDEKFRVVTSEPKFTKLLEAVHRKLGNVQQSNLRNMYIGWPTGRGQTVSLVYDTTFAQGTGTEHFTWIVKDSNTTLYSYYINSDDLIEK